MKNRYLVKASGRRVGSRVGPSLMFFGGLLGVPLLGALMVVLGAEAELPLLAALGVMLGLVAFVGSVVLQWVFIFGAASRLRQGEAAVLRGDTGAATALAHYALERVFRADFRMRAFYTLGLAAERAGHFVEAAELFALAERGLPAMLARVHETRARALCSSHAAFCLAAAGSIPEAASALGRAHALLPQVGRAGTFDGLLDDRAWGVGAASMNTTVSEIEQRRDVRAVTTLAGALLAFKNGHYPSALDAFAMEGELLRWHTQPHEQALLSRIEREALARIGGGQYRGGAIVAQPDNLQDSWARAALGER